ncbi:hypothetical protein HHL28_04485 [Aerophototrophica crusticola]|uniref:Uncharacterized protein n=1 Tax=Aerophototrophica crusticola TaxID=1709002 RepID=A0A858R5I0_9PROT|nr:hypothetical protein HHL28_04485 [Rhodospirillaceae bacterium B3]
MNAMNRKRQRSTPLEVLELFREWDPDVSLKAACAFLYVAENEGISISELAFLLRTSLSTATRVVAALGGRAAAWWRSGPGPATAGSARSTSPPSAGRCGTG